MQNNIVVPRTGLEPARLSTLAPETSASTIPPPGQYLRAENEARTRDPNLGKVVLYQLSYFRIYVSNSSRFCSPRQGWKPYFFWARLCSTNWAISAFVSQIRHFRLRSLRKSKLFHSLARKFRIHISQHRCVFRLTGAKVVQFFKPAKFLRYFLQYFLQNFLSQNK